MRRTGSLIVGGAMLILAGLIIGVLVTANCGFAPASNAQERGEAQPSVREPARGMESPFVSVANEVLPAVVSVDTKRTVRRGPDPLREMFREFFGERRYRQQFGDEDNYQEFEIPGSASGFVFDERGYVMTNNHVVQGADEIEVTLLDGREFSARIVGQDPSTDVAVVKIEGDNLPTVHLGNSDGIRVGDWAIAVGNPLELAGTVTVGVVSAVGRTDLNIRGGTPLYQDFIQTDASINFGNSGGPLVNIRGEVVGVNTAINAGANGIGFAIPINLVREVAESLMSEGKVVRGYLGVVPQEITRELAEAKDLDGTRGIIIANVEDDTPASEAGLEAGDVVLEFGGAEIADVPHFRRVVAGFGPSDTVEVVIVRDGERKVLGATLTERPDTFAAEDASPEEDEASVWFGIHVVELDDPMARQFETQVDEGVLVISVDSGSSAADGGLQAGDVIVRVANRNVRDLSGYRQAMKDVESQNKAIAIMVQRGAYTYFVAVKPEK